MRLRRLRFQAIGPFPGTHSIDFDQVASSGLFMLEGPTGSGKSTIIDAIVFALYGQVAGTESVVTRMRSDYANPATASWVELDFETNTGVYRVRRTPEYDRPKQRGSGVTKEKPTALLERLVDLDSGVVADVVASGREVATEIEHLVGLSREQFTQVVVLPQGQFAQFLQAGTADRAKLLQRVFGTEIFERVQRVLADQAKEARTRRYTEVDRVDGLVQRLAEAAGSAPEVVEQLGEAVRNANADDFHDVVSLEAARLKEIAAHTVATAELAETEANMKDRLLAEQRDLAAALSRRAQLLEQKAQVEKQIPTIHALTTKVAAARRAAPVVPLLRRRDESVAICERAQQKLEELLAQTQSEPVLLDFDENSIETLHGTWATVAIQAADERASLTDLVAQETTLPTLQQQLAVAKATLSEYEQALTVQNEERDAQREEIQTLRDQLAELGQIVETLEEALQHEEQAKQAETQRSQYETAMALVETRSRAWQESVAASEKAHSDYAAVRQAWIAGQAARLAIDLTPKTACPVCGSLEHPDPAHNADLVDDARLDAAAQAAETARTAMIRAKDSHQAACDQVTALADGLVPDAAERLILATAEVRRVKQAQQQARTIKTRLDAGEKLVETLTTSIVQAEKAVVEARAALIHQQALITDVQTRVEQGRGHHPSVAARQHDAQSRAASAQAVADAISALATARGRLAEDEVSLVQALEEHRMASEVDVMAAALDETALIDAEQTIQAHTLAAAHVAADLAKEPMASLTGAETTDVPAAQQAAVDARTLRDQSVVAASHANRRAQSLAQHAQTISDGIATIQALDSKTGPLVRMAELAAGSGSNTAHQQLSTFVLVQRFQDVLDAANVRLAAMTSGRYEMQCSQEREKGSREQRTGLGIQILDHHTERPRSPKSLSGGETFQFSLCLALGLADVVTEENGGIHMGTLFVDEGFGTLDGEVLDVVMRELNALHQHGHRAVGVVSHVAEMKSQIAERIEVRRSQQGSTLTVVA